MAPPSAGRHTAIALRVHPATHTGGARGRRGRRRWRDLERWSEGRRGRDAFQAVDVCECVCARGGAIAALMYFAIYSFGARPREGGGGLKVAVPHGS
ncbi:hypothetical protein GWI33_004614 [Rhynchophorus ferrugineus]|uniref:Uncharacterized protein n=1 Tax=Rhynchophorus ferrugineus TaxID=354439 RepID=A0A834MP18_RHYFE|nr:hypothetical protein GWI33_004614 [Rhynchophorus ferrugineus]